MSGEQQRISSAPTRADDKTNSKNFSALQKLFVVGIALSTLGGIWFLMSGQAATTFDVTLSPTSVAETITTNPNLEQGLVAHWSFDGEQIDWGSTTAEVLDRTGNQNNADATGGLGVRSVIPGVLGQALSFDGVDDVLATGAHVSHDNLGPLTLVVWIRPSISGEYCMLGNGYIGAGNETWAFGVDGVDGLFFARAIASGILQRYSVFPVVVHNEWQHVVVTWDGSTDFFNGVKLYRNGVLLAHQSSQDASPLGSDAGNTIEIGSVSGCAKAYKGDLDDLRVYSRVLPAEEITRLYGLGQGTHVAETLIPSPQLETGLVGHWTFDGMDMDWSSTTAEVRDRSGQGNNGDALGSVSPSSVVSGIAGQALVLNGVDDYVDLGYPVSLRLEDRLTVSVWVRFTNGALPLTYGVSPIALESSPNWGLFYNNAGSGWVAFYVNATRTPNIYGYADTDWHHVVGTYDRFDGLIKLYVDGAYYGSQDESNPIVVSGSETIRIGLITSGGPKYFPGAVDDVRIYNRALSADEIRRLYQLGQ